MGMMIAVIGAATWVFALFAGRRLIAKRLSAGTWTPIRAGLLMGLTWSAVPIGFELLRPGGPNVPLAAAAGLLLGLGAFLGTRVALNRVASH